MSESSGDLTSADGHNAIVYRQQSGRVPGVLFLGGFRSDMTGTKAVHLAAHCAATDTGFVRFDYRGHGASGGHYTDFTVGDWLEDTLRILDALTDGPQILVGSSLGGWLALRVAEMRPERIRAIVGIAAAPDFPTRLILPRLSPAQQKAYAETGVIIDTESEWLEPSRFTRRFVEDSAQHNIFGRVYQFSGPVHLLQGKRDSAVPWTHAVELAGHIKAPEVSLTLLDEGDHRLSTPHDLALLTRTVSAFQQP